MSYKIQNRSSASRRVKLIKNGNGTITFPGAVTPTFLENSIEAGFCLAPINPIPELEDSKTTFQLSANPMGVDGRVSIYRENDLVASFRYTDMNKGIDGKINWFNEKFGEIIQMSRHENRVQFSSRDRGVNYLIVFEDDDNDYILGKFEGVRESDTAIFVEQYRLVVGLNYSEISCEGALDWTAAIETEDGIEGTITGGDGTVSFGSNEEFIQGLKQLGLDVTELTDWGIVS